MRELFGDIILREREERQALMAGATALLEASGNSSDQAQAKPTEPTPRHSGTRQARCATGRQPLFREGRAW